MEKETENKNDRLPDLGDTLQRAEAMRIKFANENKTKNAQLISDLMSLASEGGKRENKGAVTGALPFGNVQKSVGCPFWMKRKDIDSRWIIVGWYDKTFEGESIIGCFDFRGSEFIVTKSDVDRKTCVFFAEKEK